jgi:D-alanyl-D-alanine carboxypeptidase (penicillin-binding protein 5/6)
VPVAGTIDNVNIMLGQAGIVGIKTGNTDQAGGVFLFAGQDTLIQSKQPVIVVGAIMGAPDLGTALHDSLDLLRTTYANFSEAQYVTKGQVVGYYQTKWGARSNIVANSDVTMTVWNQAAVNLTTDFRPLSVPSTPHSVAGSLTVKAGSQKQTMVVSNASSIQPPSYWWRLLHPFSY